MAPSDRKRSAGTEAAAEATPVRGNSRLPWAPLREPATATKAKKPRTEAAPKPGKAEAKAVPAAETEQEEPQLDEAEAEVAEVEPAEEDWDIGRRVDVARDLWADPNCDGEGEIDSPAFDPAALPPTLGKAGRLPFRLVAVALEAAAQQSQGPRAIRALANVIRWVLHASTDKEADLRAFMVLLLSDRMPQKGFRPTLLTAISGVFSLSPSAMRSVPTEDLARMALTARQQQRALFQPRMPTAAEVAAAITEGAQLQTALQAGTQLVEQVKGLLGRSSSECQETRHLVRVLTARPELPLSTVLKALAHGAVLGRGIAATRDGQAWSSCRRRALADTLVQMEDEVARAYGETGGQSAVLAPALAEWAATDKLLARCGMRWGVPVFPMKAQASSNTVEALERLGDGALLAEWMLDGDRAQIHTRKAGAVVELFLGGRRCPERILEVVAAMKGQVTVPGDCIFEAILVRPPRVSNRAKKSVPKEGSSTSAEVGAEADAEAPIKTEVGDEPMTPQKEAKEAEAPKTQELSPDHEAGRVAADPSAEPEAGAEAFMKTATVVVFDALMLDGVSITRLPLRERRTKLQAALQEGPCLKLARGQELAAGTASPQRVKEELDLALSSYFIAELADKASSKALGLVLKRLDGAQSDYFAGRRSGSWQAVLKPTITGAEAEEKLFACLSERERQHLVGPEAFHFCVVSARRTGTPEGVRDVLNVQAQFKAAGADPVWYVDEASLDGYRGLGLRAVVGGKLIPARNLALDDAAVLGKVCVQASDDIARWDYYNGNPVRQKSLPQGNAAAKQADRYQVSPVAAARFMLAKMRGVEGDVKPQLAGVYPLGNMGQAFCTDEFSTRNFILGDFFVVDKSDCRFDLRMSLKEDYDFTCSHLQAHGAVLRCNRLIIQAKHETNAGGACSVRDAAGERERENIRILQEKWAGAIWRHPTRANQVVLRWECLKKPKQPAAAEAPQEGAAEEAEASA